MASNASPSGYLCRTDRRGVGHREPLFLRFSELVGVIAPEQRSIPIAFDATIFALLTGDCGEETRKNAEEARTRDARRRRSREDGRRQSRRRGAPGSRDIPTSPACWRTFRPPLVSYHPYDIGCEIDTPRNLANSVTVE